MAEEQFSYRDGSACVSSLAHPHTSTRFLKWGKGALDASRLPSLYTSRAQCCGCGGCVAACPQDAIALLPGEDGFAYPVVDASRCVGCRSCERACAFRAEQLSRTPQVATLTFHNAMSCGAVLQAFALQQAIGEAGYATELLDYRNPKVTRSNAVMRLSDATRPAKLARYLLRRSGDLTRRQNFLRFANDALKVSPYLTHERLLAEGTDYETVVVGSDQVWNEIITDKDATYLLDFLREGQRRVAYAPSSGGMLDWMLDDPELLALLDSFDALSAREATDAERLSQALGRDVACVCDPVFLPEPAFWEGLELPARDEAPYLLFIPLANVTQRQVSDVRRLAAARGLKLLCLNDLTVRPLGVRTIRGAGPLDFLSLIKGAEVIATDSFHATCFSLIFGKEVRWVHTSAASRFESRIGHLYQSVGMAEQASAAPGEPADAAWARWDVDYDEVHQRLGEMRAQSRAYLLNALG